MQTFVVRVFVPVDEEGVPLRGLFERVGSCERELFESAGELIRLFEGSLSLLAREADRSVPAEEGIG